VVYLRAGRPENAFSARPTSTAENSGPIIETSDHYGCYPFWP